VQEPEDDMDCLEAIRTRRSVRAYKPDPVPPAALKRVLDCARMAPSANNVQPWHFIVVRDAVKRRQLAEAAADQMFLAEAPVVIVCCGRRYTDRWSWLGAHMYLVDCAIAFDHLTLAARGEGLGTCWIGAFDPAKIRKILRLPEDVEPLAMTPLGKPAAPALPKRRKALDEIVHRERW